ncbi:MAG: hypothetical protein ABI610_06190, partial [Acidobacteriota bacterium]
RALHVDSVLGMPQSAHTVQLRIGWSSGAEAFDLLENRICDRIDARTRSRRYLDSQTGGIIQQGVDPGTHLLRPFSPDEDVIEP